jgi:SSS family solute:Na+ symporter/cation/acetate symporter
MVKAVVVFFSMAATALVLLHHFHWRLDTLLAAAAQGSGRPDGYRAPGLLLGTGLTGRLDYLSLHITVVLGAACTPHVVMRLNAARSGATARRSTGLAIGMVGAFCALAVLLGLGASAIIGAQRIAGSDPRGNTALLLLAGQLTTDTGSSALFTAVVCAVFLTSLAVVAGLTLSAAASLAHDVYAQVVHRGSLSTTTELNAARWATLLVGAGSAGLSVALQGWNVQFLSQFAVAAAASAVLPALAYTVFWRDFTRRGLLWSVYGGLGACLLLEVFGPTVSGGPGALFPHQDFHWFPLENTGLVSVPAGFLLGWWGSRRSARHTSAATAETRQPAMR